MEAASLTTWDPRVRDPTLALAPGFRLDPIHIRILQILERDGRTSVSRIAREVGLTDNAVRYRLRKLRSSGVVRKVTVHVDPARLGRARTGLVLLRLAPGADLTRLRHHANVAMVFPTRGAYQAALVVTARDGAELDHFVQREVRQDPAVEEVMVLDVSPDADVPLPPSACVPTGDLPPA